MQQKKRYKKWLLIISGILCALYLGLNFYIAKGYVSPKRTVAGKPPTDMIDISIGGPGHPIPLWSTLGVADHKPISKNVFVLVHGYQASREAWRPLATKLAQEKQEVIVLAMRGHDANSATTSSFGFHETKEILSANRWIKNQYKNQKPNIILVGMSLGSASCWLAAEQDALVNAVVSDSGFANLKEATESWISRDIPIGQVLLRPMILMSEYMSSAKIEDVQPEKSAAKWKGKPALIIHGDSDKLLDLSHAKRLARAAQCPLWVVKGAEHACCYTKNLNEYTQRIINLANQATIYSMKNKQY